MMKATGIPNGLRGRLLVTSQNLKIHNTSRISQPTPLNKVWHTPKMGCYVHGAILEVV